MSSDDERYVAAPMSRRTAVVGGACAALGLAAAVSGCADGGTGASGGTAGSGAATAVGSTGTVVGPAEQIPVGGGRVFEALEVVVTQPAPGQYVGLSAICTHTACIVNAVAEGLIRCPCHGSRYHLDGTVAAGPAPRPLPSRPVTLSGGQIVLS